MKDIDYSLYLVTGRNLLPPNKDYLESLEEAIKGGVTVVQVREKELDTREFINLALVSKKICDKYGIPLIINDRVDVAVSIGADGVHLGQSDMLVEQARKLLPPGSIIGVSCNTLEHVRAAVLNGVDYVGIGAVWETSTKKLTSPVLGVSAVGAMLQELDGTDIKAVAIGGIKSTNLLRTLHGSVSPTDHVLDGVAVVSDIVGSLDPAASARKLRLILTNFQQSFIKDSLSRFDRALAEPKIISRESIVESVCRLMLEIRKRSPLIHQITNTVVQTQSANVTLALGASPIMATEISEMEELATISGALLVNIGTMRAEHLESMVLAGTTANMHKKPIVLDPVGIGASKFRKATVKTLLDVWQASVIKGNAGELATLAGTNEVESKGVDSLGSGFKDPVAFVRNLAKQERCVIVLTGAVDYISDGVHVVSVHNGDKVLGQITGAGCILGSCIASYCATAALLAEDGDSHEGGMFRGDMFIAAVAGVLVLTVSTELAMKRGDIKGPGTLLPGLIDDLWSLKPDDVLKAGKISVYS